MRLLKAVLAATVIIVATASLLPAQDGGATITFVDRQVRIYEGTGGMRALEPTDAPVIVGNFRIEDVRLPGESNLDYVGLVFPYRGLIDEIAINLERSWGSYRGVALICEAIDASAPIGFRMRAHARNRMLRVPGAWLELQLGRSATDRNAIPAMTRERRAGWDMHHWYVEQDLPAILRVDDPDTDRFAILLNTGGRGSYWVKWLEIKEWPRVSRRN